MRTPRVRGRVTFFQARDPPSPAEGPGAGRRGPGGCSHVDPALLAPPDRSSQREGEPEHGNRRGPDVALRSRRRTHRPDRPRGSVPAHEGLLRGHLRRNHAPEDAVVRPPAAERTGRRGDLARGRRHALDGDEPRRSASGHLRARGLPGARMDRDRRLDRPGRAVRESDHRPSARHLRAALLARHPAAVRRHRAVHADALPRRDRGDRRRKAGAPARAAPLGDSGQPAARPPQPDVSPVRRPFRPLVRGLDQRGPREADQLEPLDRAARARRPAPPRNPRAGVRRARRAAGGRDRRRAARAIDAPLPVARAPPAPRPPGPGVGRARPARLREEGRAPSFRDVGESRLHRRPHLPRDALSPREPAPGSPGPPAAAGGRPGLTRDSHNAPLRSRIIQLSKSSIPVHLSERSSCMTPPVNAESPGDIGRAGIPGYVSIPEAVWNSRTQWGAILAGAFAGFAVVVLMTTLGAALGITAGAVGVSETETVNTETAEKASTAFGIGAAIWILLTALATGLVGGWVLNACSRRDRPYSSFVFGGITWAVGVCLALAVAAPGVGGIFSG